MLQIVYIHCAKIYSFSSISYYLGCIVDILADDFMTAGKGNVVDCDEDEYCSEDTFMCGKHFIAFFIVSFFSEFDLFKLHKSN